MQPPTISHLVGMCPAMVMIAFGGVPTGRRNEKEHIKAAGTIRYKGWISIATH